MAKFENSVSIFLVFFSFFIKKVFIEFEMSRRPFYNIKWATARKCMVRGLGRGRPKVVNFLPGEEDSNNPPSAASSSLDAGAAMLFEKTNQAKTSLEI